MAIQPGTGYTFTASSQGTNLSIQTPWGQWGGVNDQQYQQFQCLVYTQQVGETTKHFLATHKGVVNYTWSQFPFNPDAVNGNAFRTFEKQARITDWAVYENGKRTAGTATDGPDFEWFAGGGKIELPTGASGKSVVVTISKIDWWDKDGWLAAYRTIDAEKPFVSVFDAADTNINAILVQQGNTAWVGPVLYQSTTPSGNYTVTYGPPYPTWIGYTVKKIAQLDWNDTTLSWDVTQYLVGPIDLPVQNFMWPTTFEPSAEAPTPSLYETYLGDEFDNCLNYAWFESMWAYPGYTMNPSAWWYDIVDS